ncbi:MAG TPA: amino acid adenylation domain-containing protein, partial [Pyrinomonadaceae bacterium]|nr:amino acid adenylation domain-containing protein [Pyrinomonadaceae bacterium]
MVAVSSEIIFFDTRLIQERDYWTEKLSGATTPSNLLLDYERPSLYSSKTETIDINLSADLCQKLAQLTSNSSFLLYTTLMAGLKICLHKYNRGNTIVVGSPPLKELGRANALAIVDEIDPSLSFKEFLLQVRGNLLEAYARQAYPFDYLVRDLEVNSLDKKCPLFDIALLLEDIHGHLLEVKHDITFSFAKRPNGLSGRASFNARLFTRETIERAIAHFINVLESALDDKNKRIHEFSLLSAGERQTLLYGWNDTAAAYPNVSIVELFGAQVERTPEATAVVYDEQQLSYAELNRRANQLAHLLRARGVRPETIAGIYLERSPELIVALLATLKAGAAYLPLDITYPSQRLRYMIADSGCGIVLTKRSLAAEIDLDQAGDAEIICLESEQDQIAAESAENPATVTGPENIAYVIYTSGSTGQPKGVMVTHHGLANYLQWATNRYAVSEAEGAPIHSSLSFDLTVTSLFTPLLAGKKVRLLKEEQGIDSLVQTLRNEGNYSLLKITPTHLEMLNQMLLPDEVEQAARALIIGGEALWGKQLDYWRTYAPHTRLINEYGPTETVVGCCVYEVGEGEEIKSAVPIGRAIANTQMYVLDAQLQPVPVGVAGDLYIGGAGLARGYAGQPALTAERFIPNPFAERGGERLYRTGDIGRWNRDGQIEYLGRRDAQVKVRGYRIELGEVEAAVAKHPSVAECAVEVREGANGDHRLACFVVTKADELNVSELREHLLGLLPEYMIPSAIIELERMPVSPNGKLDRGKLPQLEKTHGESGTSYVAPRTHVEEMLASIWTEVLGAESVSVHDDFFELGGHSLIATQVMSRVREAFNIELPVRNLFETSTIAELAQSIEQELRGSKDVQATSIERAPRDQDLPLSFAQQRLWFLGQLESRTPAYNIPIVVRLTGTLNAKVLERSLNGVVRRHEILRTNFRMVNGHPAQVIAPARDLEFAEIDLRDLPPSERAGAATRLMTEEARKCFDLEEGALLTATLLRLNEDEHILLLTMHHIICDSWSMRIFLDEIAALYEAYSSEKPSPLSELPLQYADYAVWQREWLQGEVYEKQLDYWRKQLAGSPPVLELPTDRPRPALQTTNGSRQSISLSLELTESLKRLSQKEGATLFMTLLAGFKVLLSRYTGQKDIAIGTPIAGRNRPEVEGLIGFFINTLVLRSDLSDNPSFRQLLRRVRETSLAAYAHQDL